MQKVTIYFEIVKGGKLHSFNSGSVNTDLFDD